MPILGLLIYLTAKLYFHYDVPVYQGSKSLPKLQDTVDVYTDSYGVPHIFAQNNEDLFYTTGYIIARERLFQLSLLAAVSRGEIATLLGDDYTRHDDYKANDKATVPDRFLSHRIANYKANVRSVFYR